MLYLKNAPINADFAYHRPYQKILKHTLNLPQHTEKYPKIDQRKFNIPTPTPNKLGKNKLHELRGVQLF